MRQLAWRVGLLVLVGVLSACGGGGGGANTGDPSTAAGLSVSPGSLAYTAQSGGAFPPSQVVSVAISAGDAAFVAAGVPSGSSLPSWLSLSWGTVSPTSARLNVGIASTALVQGTRTATVRIAIGRADQSLIAYRDVQVTFTVTNNLSASPAAVTLLHVIGSPVAPPLFLTLSDNGGASYPWTTSVAYQNGNGWLTLSQASGASLPTTVTVSGNPNNLTPGTYNATITVTGDGDTVAVPVSYTIRAPRISISPSELSFAAFNGGTAPSAANVTVISETTASVSYSTSVVYNTGTGWLSTTGDTATGNLSVVPNTTNLVPATYSATVTLTPSNGTPAVSFPVTYVVTASSMTLTPSSRTFDIDPASTATPTYLERSVSTASSGGQLNWTATSSVPWLTVTPSGTTGAPATLSIVPAQLETLANGALSGAVTFNYTGPNGVTGSRTVAVTLNLNLPLVRFVAPYVGFVNETKEVILRGEGFSRVTSATVDFGNGNAATDVTIVNDTEIRARPPALPQGTYPAKVVNGNSLGLHRSRADLVVVPVPTHTAGLIAAVGFRIRLIYDAERKCVYAASVSPDAIQRFCDNGTSWTTTSLALSGVKDVALTPNGAEIIAITGDRLYHVSAASFAVLSSVAANDIGLISGFNTFQSVVVPNDNRALLSFGNQHERLYRYDMNQGGNVTEVLNSSYFNGNGPFTTNVSQNGDRVITANGGTYDATDGATRLGAFGPQYGVTVDRTGNRFGVVGSVFDGDTLASIGATSNGRMTVSTTGARAYVYVHYTNPRGVTSYDITGPSIVEIGTMSLTENPGSGPGTDFDNFSNLLFTSLDGGTLFVDGTNGLLVMPAP